MSFLLFILQLRIFMEPKMTISQAAAFLNISVQAVHKRIKSKGLPIIRKQNRFCFGHETARSLFNLEFQGKTYVIQNVKGGTGKTEKVFCLSLRANLYGARVLAIDLDPQGNLTKNCFKLVAKDKPIMVDIVDNGIPAEQAIINIMPGLDILPSHFDNTALDTILLIRQHPLDKVYKAIIDKLKPFYDVIFIDCPPALNANTTAAFLAADEIISPLEPDDSAIDGLFRLEKELKAIKEKYHKEIPVKIIFNKFNARNSLSHEKWALLKDSPKYSEMLYHPYVRICQEFPNARDDGVTIFDNFRMTAAKEDIDLLTRQILNINLPENAQTES